MDSLTQPSENNIWSYRRLISAVRTAAREFVPEGERILVVSKGDDALLIIADRETAHFPQGEGGVYAGHHPGDSNEAIRHLEYLREEGWDYLLLPEPSLWWLSHYIEFERHLVTCYECICENDACIIFRLSRPGSPKLNGRARHVRSYSRDAYLARSPSETDNSMDEYARIKFRQFLAGPGQLRFDRVNEPVVSIIVPIYQQAHYTFLGLESLRSGECEIPFEVIAVDNASSDDTQALLSRVENISIARNEFNRGFGEACNRRALMARGEFVCFLNNDTLVTPGWLRRLWRLPVPNLDSVVLVPSSSIRTVGSRMRGGFSGGMAELQTTAETLTLPIRSTTTSETSFIVLVHVS